MSAQIDFDVVIVSDLHMTAGYDPRTGTFDPNEDFFYDSTFGRFVDHLIARTSTEPRRWRLVLLGDLFDFLQVEVQEEHVLGVTSSATTCVKLDIIARGHPGFFAALGRFVAAGNRVEIVIGNHDVELIWPEVQARFKELVVAQTPTEVDSRITFHPWFFYLPGMVYAEHGHQYDAVNAFATVMRPLLPSQPDRIELPLGSFFVLYLFNDIERLDPFADNIKPATRYMLWALRTRPLLVLRTLGYYLHFVVRTLRKTSELRAAEQRAHRAAYRREVVRPYAEQVGLPPEMLEAIDRLAATPASASQGRQLGALLLPLFGIDVLFPAGLFGLYHASRRLRALPRSFVTLALGLAALIWRDRRALRTTTQPGAYLLAAARQIHEQLARAGGAVPAYVFGHTHTAEQFPLGANEDMPRYLNSGTWTPIIPEAFDLLGTRERFSFVQITRDPANQEVLVNLLVWNDNAGRAEPLLLL